MGIQVKCPHGHTFKVKDKYAGKRGLCPKCADQVVVQVPDLETSQSTEKAFREAVLSEHRAANAAPPPPSTAAAAAAAFNNGDSSVFDDHPAHDSSSSGSLLGSSVLRHNIKCACGASVPMWFAKCPTCGKFLQNR